MKKVILVIEGDEHISDALLAACADRPLNGLNFYIAKTAQAADKLLSERQDIAAVVSQADGKLSLKIIDENAFDQQSSVTAKRRAINSANEVSHVNLNSILDALEKYGLLRAADSECACTDRERQNLTLSELLIKTDRLSKDIESVILDMKSLQGAIDNCPLKRSLIDKALKTNEDDSGPATASKTIIAAAIGLIGVLATAITGLLSKVIEVILSYYYS